MLNTDGLLTVPRTLRLVRIQWMQGSANTGCQGYGFEYRVSEKNGLYSHVVSKIWGQARQAGLNENDHITAINGRAVGRALEDHINLSRHDVIVLSVCKYEIPKVDLLMNPVDDDGFV